jgi:hypothetical protein
MRLGQRRIDVERPERCGLGFGIGFVQRKLAVVTQQGVCVRHPGVRGRVLRIQPERLLEMQQRLLEPVRRPLIPEVPAFQVGFVGPRNDGA